MNCGLDCIQIWYGCSLGIFDDLTNFWDESIKNKMAEGSCHQLMANLSRVTELENGISFNF